MVHDPDFMGLEYYKPCVRTGADRRRFPRRRIEHESILHSHARGMFSDRERPVYVLETSMGGCRFVSPMPMAVGKCWEMSLKDPMDDTQPRQVIRVTRCRRMSDGKYMVACRRERTHH